jgi:hypothetical protein
MLQHKAAFKKEAAGKKKKKKIILNHVAVLHVDD